jgi:hypothetical protein
LVDQAAPGTTILLSKGTYPISRTLVFREPDVTLRSKSGNRDDVILDGNQGGLPLRSLNFIPEIIAISASRVTIAGITVRYARDHAIHAYPGPAATDNMEHLLLHDLHIYDCGQQLIKVNSNGSKAQPRWVDRSILECSLVEFIDNSVMEDHGSYYYTGGLDAHGGMNWILRWNQFRNIQRQGKMMEHAVHFWSKSRGTLIENNRFENVWRAIGFGMQTTAGAFQRRYADGVGDEPYYDHIGGIIRNNLVFNKADIHLETGIELMNVLGVEVYHNTIVSLSTPFNSMEYRYPNTRVVMKNNLCSHSIMEREGAQAQLAGNLQHVPPEYFVSAAEGNLHLRAEISDPKLRGAGIESGKAGIDLDGRPRPASPDIGAYQRSQNP